MKILIVGKSESIHLARWISQIDNQGWDIQVFPSIDYGRTHSGIKNTTIHHSVYDPRENKSINKYSGLKIGRGAYFIRTVLHKLNPNIRAKQLAKLINTNKPDIVHIIELQAAGYLFLKAQKYIKNTPKILLTNWGSDIFYFQKFRSHKKKIQELLKLADYYTCECRRDVSLAKKYGFKGKTLLVSPNAGGYKLKDLNKYKEPLEKRKLIMLKGYQGWSGRALDGLKALESCLDIIIKEKFSIAIYSHQNNQKVLSAIRLFEKKHKVNINIIPHNSTHDQILKHHGQARISLGFSISDGISTSLLESITMGSFPIQTNSSCANEWVNCGKNGYIVSLNNTKDTINKIRTSLTDDNLIKKATIINGKIAEDKLNYKKLKGKTLKLYKSIHNEQ